jgi:hypothetical protein
MKYLKAYETLNTPIEGDYVFCINTKDTQLEYNTLYKIIRIEEKKYYEHAIYYFLEGMSFDAGYYDYRFRKATEEEILINKFNI